MKKSRIVDECTIGRHWHSRWKRRRAESGRDAQTLSSNSIRAGPKRPSNEYSYIPQHITHFDNTRIKSIRDWNQEMFECILCECVLSCVLLFEIDRTRLCSLWMRPFGCARHPPLPASVRVRTARASAMRKTETIKLTMVGLVAGRGGAVERARIRAKSCRKCRFCWRLFRFIFNRSSASIREKTSH